MKLKSKLIISFCIIMFVPILLSFLMIGAFFKVIRYFGIVYHSGDVDALDLSKYGKSNSKTTGGSRKYKRR